MANAPIPTARTGYLVLGMHRSGTSAVTQLLALAGADLPANVMGGDEHNAKGYFEPWRIAQLNGDRLRAAGSAWDDPFAYPFRPLPEAEDVQWRERAIALFAEEYAGLAAPLMKDPRVTVLLPFWRTVLEAAHVHARCVIPVRHPLAVAGSLARRDGFHPVKSVLVWSAYMLAAEAGSRDLPRAFVGYDALLADWRSETARIEAAHGAALPGLTPAASDKIDRFLTPGLRHNDGGGDLAALGWAGEIAALVLAGLGPAAGGGALDRQALDDAAARLAARQAEIGDLVSPMARDLDAARADLLEAQEEMERRRLYAEDLKAEAARDRGILEAHGRKLSRTLAAERRRLGEVSAEVQAALAAALSDD